jgi:hypothetical protein
MIAMKFTIELDIGLSSVVQCALPSVNDRDPRTHRRGRSKPITRPLPARTEIPEAQTPYGHFLHTGVFPG